MWDSWDLKFARDWMLSGYQDYEPYRWAFWALPQVSIRYKSLQKAKDIKKSLNNPILQVLLVVGGLYSKCPSWQWMKKWDRNNVINYLGSGRLSLQTIVSRSRIKLIWCGCIWWWSNYNPSVQQTSRWFNFWVCYGIWQIYSLLLLSIKFQITFAHNTHTEWV